MPVYAIIRQTVKWEPLMLYAVKKTNNFLLKVTLLFVGGLLNSSLHAEAEGVTLNQHSVVEIFCTETNCFFPEYFLSSEE